MKISDMIEIEVCIECHVKHVARGSSLDEI